MDKSVQAFTTDLAKVRTGRAHTGLLDHITVDYYGTPTPLNQVAKVVLIDARTIGVTPFEKKMAQAIEKAIRDSDLGLNPASSGETVRVPMPPLTEERRKELIKVVKHEAENARVAVRNLRRDAIHQLKEALKKHEVSENDERRALDEMQKMTDRHVAAIDKLLQDKEKELLAV
jgi:ribosome recycling factor